MNSGNLATRRWTVGPRLHSLPVDGGGRGWAVNRPRGAPSSRDRRDPPPARRDVGPADALFETATAETGETTTMDATRRRRTRDRARQQWYARERQRRFARFLGFTPDAPEAP